MDKSDKLISIGGILWQKYGKNRVYFNAGDLAKKMGYEWELYNTGNICSAMRKGEHISNSEMKRVLNDLDCKLYYDIDDDKYHFNNGIGTGKEYTQKAIKKIKKTIEESN